MEDEERRIEVDDGIWVSCPDEVAIGSDKIPDSDEENVWEANEEPTIEEEIVAKLPSDSSEEEASTEVAVDRAVSSSEAKDEYGTKEDELGTSGSVFVRTGELVTGTPLEDSKDDEKTSVEETERLSRLAELRLKKTWLSQ